VCKDVKWIRRNKLYVRVDIKPCISIKVREYYKLTNCSRRDVVIRAFVLHVGSGVFLPADKPGYSPPYKAELRSL
jgi:hypothetical protein